jgi:molybdopterin/thiamine biosynthesis adenylyltransferase
LKSKSDKEVIVRMASPEQRELLEQMFRRYPRHEWATFGRFGWRETNDALVLTLAVLDTPRLGDLDENVGHVAIAEPYTLRIALDAEKHPLAVAVFHSHPHDCPPHPSPIDDDMDSYYSRYFLDFAPDRPYLSIIVTRLREALVFSGRVFWRGEWLRVRRFVTENLISETYDVSRPKHKVEDQARRARLSAAFGEDAAARLRKATVAVIGAGGTGSMAIEVLARAGVGKLIVVDPDHVTDSNLERLHGSSPRHVSKHISKVAVARDHVRTIDPTCKVEGYVGALPQDEIIDALVRADVALGCTDQQHSRLALSDLTVRYLIPAIDCGVMMEGQNGRVTGQIIQLIRFLANDPCVLCRGMVTPQRISEELMSPEERAWREQEAQEARQRGEDPNPYWTGLPQLNTVGYLTGAAGALAAGYAIGWITGRFEPPFQRMQMNLLAPFFDVQDVEQQSRDFCTCRRVRGWADQGKADALISAPKHWPPVRRITN